MAVNPNTAVYPSHSDQDEAAVVDVDVSAVNPNRPTKTSAKARVVFIGGTLNPDGTKSLGGASATPQSSAGSAIVPVVAKNATGLLVKNAAGNLYSASMTAGAAAGFFIAYNAAAVPAAGAALTPAQILAAAPVLANGEAKIGGEAIPDRFGTGIVLLFSTTLDTYTAPANVAVFMRGKAA